MFSKKEKKLKKIEYEEHCNKLNIPYPEYFSHFYPNGRLLFFDIETTGFAARHTTLYLIGVLWYECDTVKIIQWFNEDGDSERELLTAFDTFSRDFTHLIHFNGLRFDLPYLTQKAEQLKVPFEAARNLISIDIYKEIRAYQKILGLENMKQVSIEQYLRISRQDIYSGKELIHMYQRHVAKPDDEIESLLLLHNHDDLLGMPQISQILNYKAFFEKIEILSSKTQVEGDQLIITFTHATFSALPGRISLSHNNIYLNGIAQTASLQIPILHGTLKHYFTDYRNYYYLPKEDMAIHKSIAAFVEPENKEKAKKENGYVKKDGCFLPCPTPGLKESFQIDHSDKMFYQTVESLDDTKMQTEYIKNTLLIFSIESGK